MKSIKFSAIDCTTLYILCISNHQYGKPANDERDNEFATKYNIDIIDVIESEDENKEAYGTLINSAEFTGMESKDKREKDKRQETRDKTYKGPIKRTKNKRQKAKITGKRQNTRDQRQEISDKREERREK